MLDLPQSTAFGRRIPKQKFYEHLPVTPQIKRLFIEQISLIYWQNKIAPSTLNVAAGNTVAEIEVFRLKLNQRSLDKRILQLIDKEIPYHILHLLECGDEIQACIGYKENSQGKTGTYYQTDWLDPEDLTLRLDGLDMDIIYENFVRQIAGERLDKDRGVDIGEAIARDKRRQKLMKEVAVLEKKVQREKQFNRQVELNGELQKLNTQLHELNLPDQKEKY